MQMTRDAQRMTAAPWQALQTTVWHSLQAEQNCFVKVWNPRLSCEKWRLLRLNHWEANWEKPLPSQIRFSMAFEASTDRITIDWLVGWFIVSYYTAKKQKQCKQKQRRLQFWHRMLVTTGLGGFLVKKVFRPKCFLQSIAFYLAAVLFSSICRILYQTWMTFRILPCCQVFQFVLDTCVKHRPNRSTWSDCKSPNKLKPTFQLFKTGKYCNSLKCPEKLFHFSDFLQLWFVRPYLRNYNASLWDWFHNPCFGSVSWCNFHHKNITRLTSLEPKCHFCLQMA